MLTADFPNGQDSRKRPPSGKICWLRFQHKTLYQLCDSIFNHIAKEINDPYGLWTASVQSRYGDIEDYMSVKKFLRCIFLALTADNKLTEGYYSEVTLAKAKWHYEPKDTDISSRMKAIYRFMVPDNQKGEIIMQDKSMFTN